MCSRTSPRAPVGDYGFGRYSGATRRVAIMPPERIRTLPFGTGLTLLRGALRIVTDLGRWTSVSVRLLGQSSYAPEASVG